MKRILLLICAMAIALGGLAGCGKKGVEGNELIYGSSDYTSINPALYEHGEINSLLFIGLTTRDEGNKIKPAAAEKWEYDKASKTYTFTLRDGLTFHDGETLTAEDVKYTIEAIMNPDNESENASNFEDIKDIKVVDEKTVKISLKEPNVAILDYLTIGILPKHILEKDDDMTTSSFNQNPIGAGPYKIKDWKKGEKITMEKFDDFYKGAPKIDTVVFKVVEDDDARVLQMESGELNLSQITPKSISKFDGKNQYSMYIMKTADYRGIMYNFNNPLFKNNKELPKALSYAIDREAIVKSVLLDHGASAFSPLQIHDFMNSQVEKYDYNPSKTEDMLKEAGWKLGKDAIYEKNGQKLSFTINCSQGDQVRVDMANICAQNFKDIGIDVKVKTPAETDWANQEAFLIGWGSPFDADDHTYKVFGTDKGANYSGYSNTKIDEILRKARATEDNTEREKLYKEFQVELAKDPAYTFIAYIDAPYVADSKISGITKSTVLGHHGVGIFWNVYDWEIK